MLVYCMNLKIFGKVFTSKFVGTGPSYYEKGIYRAAVSQNLRNTDLQYNFRSTGGFRVYGLTLQEHVQEDMTVQISYRLKTTDGKS
jgi:hypothetical protein